MKKLSKRRKLKDNPYTLLIENNKYYVLFKGANNIIQKQEVTEDIFNTFDDFELDDKKILNEFSRHMEHLSLSEEIIYRRSIKKPITIEQQMINELDQKIIRDAIGTLSVVQKRRIIKYFFEGKSEYEIAKEERTSQQSINASLHSALHNLAKKLKK